MNLRQVLEREAWEQKCSASQKTHKTGSTPPCPPLRDRLGGDVSTRTLRHRPKRWWVTTHNNSHIYHGRYKTIAHIVAAWHWLFGSTNIKIIHH